MQTQILLFIVVLFSFFTTIKAQPLTQTEIDSLKVVWNNTKLPDTTRLQAIKKISDGYYFTNPDSSFYFAQLLYDLAEATGHKKWIAMALNIQAGNKFLKGEYDQALEYFSLCINIFEEIGETKFIAKGMNNLGNVYVEKGNQEKALEYFLRSLKMFEELQDKENIGGVLSNIGGIYFKQGNLDQALIYLNKSRKICKEAKDLNGQASAQNIIGTIYEQQGDLEQALEIFTQNLELYKKIGFKQAISVTLFNIGGIYKKNGDYEKALENYIIALETFEEIGNTAGIAAGSRIIGDLYLDQKNYPLALEYLNRSLTISEETGSKEGISMALAVIAGIYEAQGDYAKAISFGTRALPLFQEMGNMLWTNAITEHLLISYRATGQYKEALEMADLYMETKDSLNSQENQKAIIQTQVQSEYDKQKAIDDIENEKRVAIEKQKKENQQILSASIGLGLLLVIILAIGLWHRNRFIKKTNTALAIAKDRAETSEKYKEQFLANMSHEIRTPMHAISGMIKILQRNEHPPAQDVYLNAMKTSSENLVVILNDVLDLSKIEAGKLEIEHIPMNPAFVIENVIQILKYKAEEKGLILSYKVANDVPSLVMGDPTRLNQILVNLCGNAIKFTEKGKVDISLHIENEQLHFQINDTGIGIPKSEQNIIFTAFKQAKESTARFYGGTGLGLSISKQLVELQHGRIWLESTEGTGSTFYVTFPLIIAEARSTDHGLYSEAELQSMATSLRGIHILIAEDNPFNQMIAQDDLSYYIKDITIDLVENGALAVEKFKSHHFDLILMDVQMPELNGIEAAEKIREIERSEDRASAIPIIAMTASLLKTEIDTCLLSGMDNYIPKPYTPVELIGPIYKALRA